MGETIPFGFIYQLTHLPTGKKYIGKKQLISVRKKPLTKKEIESLPNKRSKKYKIVETESDWKTYYGSHSEIKQMIKSGKSTEFDREILQFVFSKKLLTYYECKELFNNKVLEDPDTYWNDNILSKFFRKDFDLN